MAQPYIPARDAAFDAWLRNFDTLISDAPASFGLTVGEAAIITGLASAFAAAYIVAIDPVTRTSSTIAAKDAARANAESACRVYAIRIRDNPAVTDAQKVAVGVTVPSFPPSPIPAPTVAPALSIIAATPLAQTLGYRDPSAGGRAKPFGVTAVEIWRSVGTVAATDPDQCRFVGLVTKTPFRQNFPADDQGKIATYFARFATRSGPGGVSQTGPWSARLTVIVL